MKLCRFVEVMFAIKENELLKQILEVFPGSKITSITFGEATQDDGFGRIVQRGICPLSEFDCSCDARTNQGLKGRGCDQPTRPQAREKEASKGSSPIHI